DGGREAGHDEGSGVNIFGGNSTGVSAVTGPVMAPGAVGGGGYAMCRCCPVRPNLRVTYTVSGVAELARAGAGNIDSGVAYQIRLAGGGGDNLETVLAGGGRCDKSVSSQGQGRPRGEGVRRAAGGIELAAG